MRRVAASVTVTVGPDGDAGRLHGAQQFGVAVAHAQHAAGVARRGVGEQHEGLAVDLAGGIRNRIAVRVEPRAAQALVDALEQPVADRVLEHLGLVVHFVPRVAELAHEPRLDQAVAADDRCRAVLAGRR